MNYTLPASGNFVCRTITTRMAEECRSPVQLSDGVCVFFKIPFEVDQFWESSLGSIQSRHLTNSNLQIFAYSDGTMVPEQDLSRLVDMHYNGLLLQSGGYSVGGMSLGGVFSSGRMHLNSVTFIDDFHNPFKVIPEPIDLKALKLSTLIAKGIQTLFANEKENGAYLRLRKGFNAFISSTKEKQAHTRLHGFVRAIEAVIKPRRGGATEQFVERGQFFAGNVAKAQTILRELYELRSAAEHLNPMKDKLLVYPADQRENVLATRTYQSELLASHALRTILLDQSLLERFETDDTTGDFWKQTPDQLLRTWGQTIDLEAALDGTFYDYL